MQTQNGVLTVKDQFYLDGKPLRILSGAMHYFRVHPDSWHDRLTKMRACGLNTVETYVAWNFHEPKRGAYNFEGFGDIVRFVRTAAEVGLKVIVRPGPYICAEWENGGFPGWLGADTPMRLRCDDPAYLREVDRWFSVLLPKLVPLLCTHGGPILAMQIENEYGSFGNDKPYLRHIEATLRANGVDCLLLTSDGPTDLMLRGGTLPDVFKTVNFGSRAKEAFQMIRAFQPGMPPMCMEFWCGWFDHWGEPHHTRDAEDAAQVLDDMLAGGGSVNFYMFHGGTNFGFWNGANMSAEGEYQPTVTSYDYDALLDEAGNITPKYEACKRVIEKHFGPAPEMKIAAIPARDYGPVEMTQSAPLWDVLDTLAKPVHSAAPLSMEALGEAYGYVLYRTRLEGPIDALTLTIPTLRDRGWVYLDGQPLGILYRGDAREPLTITVPDGKTARLDILVENMGRVNYGTWHELPKGISGHVKLDYQCHFGWDMYALPMDTLPQAWAPATDAKGPAFFRGEFTADEAADTYLDVTGFTKGIAFVNGFNLGRYWAKGPQVRLFVPGPLLRKGGNEIVLFETEEGRAKTVALHAEGKLDP